MTRTAIFAVLLGLGAGAATHAQPAPVALVGAKVLTVSGADLNDAVVLLRDGKIERVGEGLEVPAGYERIEVANGGVVIPGMIDLHAYLGAHDDLHEDARVLTPGFWAADAFDPFHPEVEKARASGVTTFVLAPRTRNVIGGRVAVVKMPAPGLNRPRYLRRAGPFALSLGGAARQTGRMPTSRTGVVDLLRETILRARGPEADRDPVLTELKPILGGRDSVFMHVETAVDARAAVALARDFGFRACLVHARAVGDAAGRIGASCSTGTFAGRPGWRRRAVWWPSRPTPRSPGWRTCG